MLDKLFGSNTRVLLLRLFLNNPNNYYFVRELSRISGCHLNAVRRELDNLESIGIIKSFNKKELSQELGKEIKNNKKFYKLNNDFIFIQELRSLLVKAHIILEQSLVRRVEKMGNISFFLLSGIFVGRNDAPVDLLIVGRAAKNKINSIVKYFEKDLERDIKYTIMNKEDFLYRKEVADKFLNNLLNNRNLVVLDKISK